VASKPGSHFKQHGSIDVGVCCIQCLVLFHNTFLKTGKFPRFANELPCGINYLAQKKTGQRVRFFPLSNPTLPSDICAGSIGSQQVSFFQEHKNRT
jgi:hypothetical protein